MYTEDEMLMLSGIQHYMFCPRQWALIHIEQQWDDNSLTVEGNLIHRHVDNPFYRQKCGDIITLRAVPIASRSLGLYGITDIVELYPSNTIENSLRHSRYPGYWKPYPLEYKHGHSKTNGCDEVQLTAQVICLEEMYGITIDFASLYYADSKKKIEITIDEKLRNLTINLAEEMHTLFNNNSIPPAIMKPHCKNCSLVDICLPKLNKKHTVRKYLYNNLYEETT